MKRSKHNHETSAEKIEESSSSNSDSEVEEKKYRMSKSSHTKHKHHRKDKKSKHQADSDEYENNKHKSHDRRIKTRKKSSNSSSEEEFNDTDRKIKRSEHDTNSNSKHDRHNSSDSESSNNKYSHRHKRSGHEIEDSESDKKHHYRRKHHQSSKYEQHSSSSKSGHKQSSNNTEEESKYKPERIDGEIKKEEREDSRPHSHRSHSGNPSVKIEINESRHRHPVSVVRPQSSSSSKHRGDDKKRFCDESEEYEWGRKDKNNKNSDAPNNAQPKQKPDFGLSGKLTEDTNMYNGVVIKYSEPPDARKPKRRWRLYPFKDDKQMPVLHIHRQSAFLMGRDRKVADIPIDHPSCSKQHAALQYRLTDYSREDGSKGKRIRLYVIDLESANGTFVNNKKIEPKRYVELLEKDVIKFGFSSREYVLLHEHSKDSDLDDDVTDDQ